MHCCFISIYFIIINISTYFIKIKFQVFTDGITNKLLGCYLEDEESSMILVRVNGEGTDIIINRAEEQDAFHVLSEADCAPPVYCVFKNGMAYGFFPGVPLDEKTVREPKIQRYSFDINLNLYIFCYKVIR